MSDKKFRLITRSDFDGLMCGVLLKQLDMIDAIEFVHPKDMQDGKVAVTANDITTNLPYVEGVHMAFDHHASEIARLDGTPRNMINDPNAPSTARVVYEHFGGKERFPSIGDDLMAAVDKTDAAQFSPEEVLNPQGWVLLGFLMDNRTGLGRFREFRISNRQLMMDFIEYLGSMSLEALLSQPDIKERVDLYKDHAGKFKEQLLRCSKVHKNLVVLDLRGEDMIYAGNRFVIYGLYPECNISAHLMYGFQQQNTVIAVGKSILNRSSKTKIGDLMLKYGGGGHDAAGTCQVANDKVEQTLEVLVEQINRDG